MDSRAALPVTLPRPDPTIAYWQDPPATIANHRTTESLPTHVSTVILGSGITGASIAYRLLTKRPSDSILILEARAACSGASGRNGGHTKCASYRSFLDNAQALGEEEAVRIARFEYSCMKSVHAFAREHNIPCDSWEGDTVDVIYDQGQWHSARRAVVALQKRLGPNDPTARYQFWNSEEAEKKFLTPGAVGAVSYEAGSLSAYKFVVGVLNLALDLGLNLQTNTPATSLTKMKDGWDVNTARGTVHAKRIILATNGYTASVYPSLQGSIVPLRGHVSVHRPGSGIPTTGLSTTYSFIYADGYDYMTSRPNGSDFAGDIVIGGGVTKAERNGILEFGTTDDTTTEPSITQYLKECTATSFGQHWGTDNPQGRVSSEWSGIMGYSADGLPLVGKIPGQKDLFIAASFQGHGMVLSFLTAKALVELMDEHDGDSLHRWFPRAFLVTTSRVATKFSGRLHTTAAPE